MTLVQGYVGPQQGVDGGNLGQRQSRDGCVVTQAGHADYQESTFRNHTWSLTTAAGGVTIGATNVYSSTGPATPIVGIYNPVGSGINAYLLYTKNIWASGTAAAQGLVLGLLPAAAVTAAGGNGAISLLTGVVGGSKVSTFVNSALTGQTVAHTLLDFIGGPTTGADAANSPQWFLCEHKGLICCPPGASLGVFAAAAGTSPIVAAAMQWTEESAV